jgi:hypothetical protein
MLSPDGGEFITLLVPAGVETATIAIIRNSRASL